MKELIDNLSELIVTNAAQFAVAAKNLDGKLGVLFAVQHASDLTIFSQNRVELLRDKKRWLHLMGQSKYQLLMASTLEYIPETSSIVCWMRDVPGNPHAVMITIAIEKVAQIEP